MEHFFNSLREELTSIWTLLKDTEIFLTRINKFDEYENELREWRNTIQHYNKNHDMISQIKQEIINFRKSLRLQGYDLLLGSKDVKVFGFKNDEAVNEGYRRIVVAINDDNIYYMTGDDNHQELMRYLCLKYNVVDIFSLGEVHSLWFRWRDNILQLSGADSESKEDLEIFRKYLEKNKSLVLKKLKNVS